MRDVFETLQFKSARSKTTARTHKTETFPLPRVLMVRMSRNEAIFDGLSTKQDIFDALSVENEDIIEGEVSEATVMEIDNFRNECVR